MSFRDVLKCPPGVPREESHAFGIGPFGKGEADRDQTAK